ncbi:hypothetical protein VTI74DRAFT_541 [Chaetomium olivicolor]
MRTASTNSTRNLYTKNTLPAEARKRSRGEAGVSRNKTCTSTPCDTLRQIRNPPWRQSMPRRLAISHSIPSLSGGTENPCPFGIYLMFQCCITRHDRIGPPSEPPSSSWAQILVS